MVAVFVVMVVLQATMGVRVSRTAELIGLDLYSHQVINYKFGGTNDSAERERMEKVRPYMTRHT